MLAIRLPEEIGGRFDALAKATGRSKTYYAWEAILEHLDDVDVHLTEQRLIDIRPGRSEATPLNDEAVAWCGGSSASFLTTWHRSTIHVASEKP